MDLGPPIVAVATPPGHSARGIVRMSGAGSHQALLGVSVGASIDVQSRAPQRVTLGLPSGALPALALVHRAPRTFTGEDTVELMLPGNPLLLAEVVDTLLAAADRRGTPARGARPGEFTMRAMLHGRLSLDRAEGVAIASAARHDDELRAARLLADGRLGALVQQWSDEVTELLALVESGIDFTDEEDVVAISADAIASRSGRIAEGIEQATAHALRPERLVARPTVVLVGAPNAGKSSLFNALIGAERAVATPIAGTTRDSIEHELRIAGASGAIAVTLVDVPGDDDGTAPGPEVVASPPEDDRLEALGREASRRAIARADLLLRCVPITESSVGSRQRPRDRQELLVRTKCDLLAGEAAADAGLAVSAHDGTGLTLLRRAMADAIDRGDEVIAGATLALTERQDRLLRDAAATLGETARLAGAGPGAPGDAELVASALRTALDRLGEITGRVFADDILGAIFSRFCIGK